MHSIALGCDPNASRVKRDIMEYLEEQGYHVKDFGSDDVIYANTAVAVCKAVTQGKCDRGILICGTGIGMSIAANKIDGAYAALLSDCYSAERARKSNNANIACLGAQTIGIELAKRLLDIFLTSEYVGGTPSEAKVKRIEELNGFHG